MTKKELIITLIKNDLTNTRLIRGLELLGLNSGNYYLHLSEIVFSILKISNEDFYEKYIKMSNAVMHIDIFEHPKKLNELALRLYNMLIKKSKSQKHAMRKRNKYNKWSILRVTGQD